MEVPSPPTTDQDNWIEEFDHSLADQRDRVQEFLAAQQARLRQAEEALSEQLEQVAGELARDRDEARRAQEEIEQRSEQLKREAEHIEALKGELAARREEWEQFQQQAEQQRRAFTDQVAQQQQELQRRNDELAERLEELNRRRPEIESAEAELRQGQQALELAQQRHEAEVQALEEEKQRVAEKQAELDTLEQEHLQEIERQRAEIQRLETESQQELKRQLDEACDRADRLAAEIEANGKREEELDATIQRLRDEETELNGELAAAQKRGMELAAELDSLRQKCAQLEQGSADLSSAAEADSEQSERYQAERDELIQRLADADARLEEAQRQLADGAPAAGGGGDEEFQRRYEMAMEDVRDLKAENAELKERLENAPSAGSAAGGASAAGGSLDWEAEKLRILAALESDFDPADEEDTAERLKIEEVVARTDRIIAVKDREIEELRQRLEESSGSESVAVGAAALGEVLDADEIVQEERKKLQQLQEECREKLAKAEIDLSVERAKIARQKAELEEKVRVLEDKHQDFAADTDDVDKTGKPVRGRWLARLGLKDDESEE